VLWERIEGALRQAQDDISVRHGEPVRTIPLTPTLSHEGEREIRVVIVIGAPGSAASFFIWLLNNEQMQGVRKRCNAIPLPLQLAAGVSEQNNRKTHSLSF
jgi:hypothetical protein